MVLFPSWPHAAREKDTFHSSGWRRRRLVHQPLVRRVPAGSLPIVSFFGPDRAGGSLPNARLVLDMGSNAGKRVRPLRRPLPGGQHRVGAAFPRKEESNGSTSSATTASSLSSVVPHVVAQCTGCASPMGQARFLPTLAPVSTVPVTATMPSRKGGGSC